jgi:hypothetical protein
MNLRVPVVKDLADAACVVAVGLEPERERLDIRIAFAEVDAVIPDSQRVGASAGEQRRSRRVADGLLAIGVREQQAPSSEAVEVWCLSRGAITASLGPKVIGHDQEHVRCWSDSLAFGGLNCELRRVK